jgi:dephospho-CoA kinase
MQDLFDKIMFVYCDDELRLERLIARNNYSKEYAQTRMAAQESQDLKVKKSDYVIYNNDSIVELDKQVNSVIAELLSH